MELEEQPADVGVEKAFRDAVGIIVMIDVLMVPPMFARPHQDRVFERGRAENKSEKPDWPAGLEGHVREKPVITDGDAESASCQEHDEERDLEPVDSELPKINGNDGEGEHERADEKRTGDPIDSIEREGANETNRPGYRVTFCQG